MIQRVRCIRIDGYDSYGKVILLTHIRLLEINVKWGNTDSCLVLGASVDIKNWTLNSFNNIIMSVEQLVDQDHQRIPC